MKNIDNDEFSRHLVDDAEYIYIYIYMPISLNVLVIHENDYSILILLISILNYLYRLSMSTEKWVDFIINFYH